MKSRFLIIIAVFLLLLPWIKEVDFTSNNEVMVDEIPVSTIAIMTITIVFSIISWSLFSWASKNISFPGFLLSMITGTSLVIPFIQVLGSMAGVIVGVVAGFTSFILQKQIADPTRPKPLVITAITLTAAYFVLITMILASQTSSMEKGIGEWTGTADGIEKTGFENIFNNGIGFVFFLAIIPSLIIMGLVIRNKKINTRFLIFAGIIIMIQGFLVTFYVSFVLLLPTEPPMMSPIEGIDFVFFVYRQEFLFSGIIGIFVTITGIIQFLKERIDKKNTRKKK